ncbi:MAG: hypothetical protein ACI9H8_002434 [Lysobacterales bacterium]
MAAPTESMRGVPLPSLNTSQYPTAVQAISRAKKTIRVMAESLEILKWLSCRLEKTGWTMGKRHSSKTGFGGFSLPLEAEVKGNSAGRNCCDSLIAILSASRERKIRLQVIFTVLAFLLGGRELAAEQEPDPNCGLNKEARQLALLIIQDTAQQRLDLRCNSRLSEIADSKAREMAELGLVAHIGRSSANSRLVSGGYPLSKLYPRGLENNVEAIAGGISSATQVWREFKNSKDHHMHLLGGHDFYLLQDEIGAGYFKDPFSPHVEYWVVYVAHRDGDENFRGQVAKSKD